MPRHLCLVPVPFAVVVLVLFSGGSTMVAVEPSAFGLEFPRPNLSSGHVVLAYTLGWPSPVWLAVYDGLGRAVAVLVEGTRPAGRHAVAFDGSGLPVGVYLVRLEVADPVRGAGGGGRTQRLSLVR